MDLTSTIVYAMNKAQNNHIAWTGGNGIGWGAEYLLTTQIAQELSQYLGTVIRGIHVEYSIEELAEEDQLKITDSLRKGRCDICVEFSEDDQTIIEVKNTLTHKGNSFEAILKDIDRIKKFLDNGRSFQYGYVCFIGADDTSKSSSTALKEKIESWINTIKNVKKFESLCFGVNNFEIHKVEDDDQNWHWASVVLKIQAK